VGVRLHRLRGGHPRFDPGRTQSEPAISQVGEANEAAYVTTRYPRRSAKPSLIIRLRRCITLAGHKKMERPPLKIGDTEVLDSLSNIPPTERAAMVGRLEADPKYKRMGGGAQSNCWRGFSSLSKDALRT
jgi:hypothetical protein